MILNNLAFDRGLRRVAGIGFFAALLAACLAPKLYASENGPDAHQSLPEAPSALLDWSSSVTGSGEFLAFAPAGSTPDVARKYGRIVKAGQQAVPLSAKDKLVLSLVNQASITSIGSSAFSSALGYWHDDTPHYGVNLPAYGQRFGAAYLKASTDSFLSYGLYAALFHDDPRYYVMGRKEKIMKRAIYSASRVVITRKDDGDSAVNWPKLAGIASAAALTNLYYPDRDRRVGRTTTSALSTIATTAGVNELHEFIGDAVRLVFHKHRDANRP